MSRPHRNQVFRLGIAVLAVLMLQIPAVFVATPESCEEADQWARANIDTLGRDLTSLSELPPQRRLAVFNLLTDNEKAAVWHAQIESFQATNAGRLSQEQHAAIQQYLAEVRPEVYAAGEPSLALRRAAEKVRLVFTDLEDVNTFYRLGPAGPTAEPSTLASSLGLSRFVSLFAGSEYCECSMDDDPCPTGERCDDDGNGCVEKGGCGPSGTSLCDGECVIIPPALLP